LFLRVQRLDPSDQTVEIREEIKPKKLSFTEIAKTVGERWQSLSPLQKEPYERQANAVKDTFNREMTRYKKTPHYREYMQYLGEFRAKNAGFSGGKFNYKRRTGCWLMDCRGETYTPR
jgi:hypothetical protein